MKQVPSPTVDSTSIRPPWREMTACVMCRPSPVPTPGALVVKKGSNRRGRTSAGMPGPVSQMRTWTPPSSVGIGVDVDRAAAVHGVRRVVDQVGPHLVELRPVGLDLRQVRRVVPRHVDPGAQLGTQDDQRVVQALAHVDALHRRLVEVGVALHRAHDLADPLAGHGHLAQQRFDLGRCRQPRAAVARRVGVHAGEGAAQLVHAPAGVDQGGGLLGIARPAPAARPRHRRAPAGRWGPGPGWARCPAGRAVGGACRARRSPHPASCTDRRMAAAGLFSSCARPAASVPSPASFSRWRTNSSSERSRSSTVRTSARAASGPESSRASRPSPRNAQHLDLGDGPDRCLPLGALQRGDLALDGARPNPGQRLLGRRRRAW